jgi:hypothetical protein
VVGSTAAMTTLATTVQTKPSRATSMRVNVGTARMAPLNLSEQQRRCDAVEEISGDVWTNKE